MTVEELMKSDKEMLTPQDIAPILGCNHYKITVQARQDKRDGVNNLGFPAMVIGVHVKIPRRPFMKFLGLKEE